MKIIKKYKTLCTLGLVDILALVIMFVIFKGYAFIPFMCYVLLNVLILVLSAVYCYIKGIKEHGLSEEDKVKFDIGQFMLIIFMILLPVILEKLFG